MEQLTTIAVAILGSGVLSTIISLLSNRWRDDRHAERLEAWVNEGTFLEDLERRAGLENSNPANRPRNLAIATAGRTYINTAIANRLVPKNNFEVVGYLIGGLLLAIMGLSAITLGLAATVGTTDPEQVFMGWVLALVGAVAMLFAGLGIFKGSRSEFYRGVMRSEVQRTLNIETSDNELENPYASRFEWLAGHEPEFIGRHKIALSADLRQSFSYFMQNAFSSGVITPPPKPDQEK